MNETKWRLLVFILLLRSLIVLSAFSLNHHLELSDSRSRYCRQAVKVETDGRHGRARDHRCNGDRVYTHHRVPLGIYKRNLDQANSNHFVPIPVFLFQQANRYTWERREEYLYAVCEGNRCVERCISGRKRRKPREVRCL